MSNEITPRWRPMPRKPGLSAAQEAAQCEDAIVAALCSDDMSVSSAQLAAAVQLAKDCAAASLRAAYAELIAGRRTPRYRLPSGTDQWLHRAAAAVDAVPDPATMERLREITDSIPPDAAAIAALNAARWLARKHGGSVQLH
jgi:hypothetical protein